MFMYLWGSSDAFKFLQQCIIMKTHSNNFLYTPFEVFVINFIFGLYKSIFLACTKAYFSMKSFSLY